MFSDINLQDVDKIMQQSLAAFKSFATSSLSTRAALMRRIAVELEALGDELIQTTMRETHLPEARLKGERGRTIFQLNSYADACEKGVWLEASITTAIPDKVPPRPDIRKMLVPLGPVVVFGSSNFPYAYSTAGGDTASALAAGCTVVVKAHPAHPETSALVAGAINRAVNAEGLDQNVFQHVYGASHAIGEALVKHDATKAVGFTGSFNGGMALFNWANQRKSPIPVFAEMGSVNPVYLLPQKLQADGSSLAKSLADSITLGVGQFCTNPGLIIGIKSNSLDLFISDLGKHLQETAVGNMLHEGIFNAYCAKSDQLLSQQGVQKQTVPGQHNALGKPEPILATTTGDAFLSNPVLHEEVFGPLSLVVVCNDLEQLKDVAAHMDGQLTSTLMATEEEAISNQDLIQTVQNACGRIIFNGVPTGVEVCQSMQHGGPFPASTDSRFTSVGADAIKRFARPQSYQNWPDTLLPDPLKRNNPCGIVRSTNDLAGLD